MFLHFNTVIPIGILVFTNWVKTTDRDVIQIKDNSKVPQKTMWGGSGDTECYAVRCFFEFGDLLYKKVQQIVVQAQLKEQRPVGGRRKEPNHVTCVYSNHILLSLYQAGL